MKTYVIQANTDPVLCNTASYKHDLLQKKEANNFLMQ